MSGRQARWLLVVLLIGEFVVLSRQLATTESGPSLLERMTVRALGPLAHAVTGAEGQLSGFVERRRRSRTLREENRRLQQRVAEMERELLRRQSVELDFQRLAAAVRYSREASRDLQVGDVVYLDHASARRSILVAIGGGAEVGQTVVDASGVVGRVVVASGRYAKVQLVTDPASAVGAMLERSRRQGVARGAGAGTLRLEYVPSTAEVRVGDRVVSAGIDGIYPRGLPLGTVEEVTPGNDLFLRIRLRPAVDFGLLDTVYVLPPVERPFEEGGAPDALP